MSPFDKGKGIVVMPLTMYSELVEEHTAKDKEVSWEELEEAQRIIRSHSRSVGKILNIGDNEGERNVTRCYSNLLSHACDPPVLRALAKTHKAPNKEGLPKSRPIVGASRGLTTPLGEILSDLLEPVARARVKTWEAQSTEEVLRKISEANSRLEREGIKEVMVGSLDVEALYPSIDQKEGPRIVAREVLKSNVDIGNINYHLAVVYLGTTMSRARQVREGVAHLIPPRKAKTRRGRRVTVHTRELGGPRGRKVLGEDTSPIGKNLDEDMEADQDQEAEMESKFSSITDSFRSKKRD